MVWDPETSEEKSALLPPPLPPMLGSAGQAEVGGLHDGAGDAGDLRLLHVDQQLGGRARRQRAVGAGGDGVDERAGPDRDGGDERGHAVPETAGAGQVDGGHAPIMARRCCESAENL